MCILDDITVLLVVLKDRLLPNSSRERSAQFRHSFTGRYDFQSSTFGLFFLLLLGVCPSFLWSLKIQKRHAS